MSHPSRATSQEPASSWSKHRTAGNEQPPCDSCCDSWWDSSGCRTVQLEEICSPGPSQRTRARRDNSEWCRTQLQMPGLAFPNLWWCLDKSFGFYSFIFFFFSSSFSLVFSSSFLLLSLSFFSFSFLDTCPNKTVLSRCLQPCVTVPPLMNLQ